MMIRDSMKKTVFSIRENETIAKAAKLFMAHHIGMLPVVNAENRLVGIVTLKCILRITMPDFVDLVEHFSFLQNLGAVESRQPDPTELYRPVREIMREPFYVSEDKSLLHTAAILQKEGTADIPVVDEHGQLVGLASHVDVGTALIKNWDIEI